MSNKVYSLKEIFSSAFEDKDIIFNIIVKIISTDILIKKQINITDELKMLKATVADATGSMNIIVKNEQIEKIKLGNIIVIRKLKLELLDGYLYLLCDKNTSIFDCKNYNDEKLNIDVNYSKIKLCLIDPEAIL